MSRPGPRAAGSPAGHAPSAGEDRTPSATPNAFAALASARGQQHNPSPPPPPPAARVRPPQPHNAQELSVEPAEQTWVGFDSHWEGTPSGVDADWLPPLPASRPKATRPVRRRATPPPRIGASPPEARLEVERTSQGSLPPHDGSSHHVPPAEARPKRASRGSTWVAGVAVVLGAAGLVAAGYSAAYIQQLLHQQRTPMLLSAATHDVSASAGREPVVPSAEPVARSAGLLAPTPLDAAASPVGESASAAPSANQGRAASRPRSASSRVKRRNAHERHSTQSESESKPAATTNSSAVPAPEHERMHSQDTSEDTAEEQAQAPVITVTRLATTIASASPPSSGVLLQPRPSRDAVRDTMLGARAMLAECAGAAHGTSYANLTIQADGRVTYSLVDGAFAGTPEGSCMAKALRKLSFPHFSGPPFKVRFPLVF